MNEAEASVVNVADTADLVAPIVFAFNADPFVRWMMPRSSVYVDVFTGITRLHGERVGPAGGAWALADGRGAAFWYPPGVEPDGEALGAVFARAGTGEEVAAVWEQIDAHAPSEPHWYLRQIGIDPTLQGSGAGAALMAAALAEIDRAGDPAYLEATSDRSRRFYERHGFEPLAEVSVDGSPPLWPMLRPAV